jgi:phosphate butyryltransferase
MIVGSFAKMEAEVLAGKKQNLALACAQSDDALTAVGRAAQAGIISPLLVGDEDKIKECCERNAIDTAACTLFAEADNRAAAAEAVRLVREGEAQLLMKGMLDTGDFLRAVLSSTAGLRTDQRLCSVVAIESKSLNRIFVLADVGTNIAPGVAEKASIIESSVLVAKALGAQQPKVAVLAAHENVQPESMPITAEGAILAKMAQRGQIRGGGLVEGPISMDLAVNERAAAIKNFQGQIKGDADVLIAPNLEVGNILIKGLMYMSGDIRVAGIGMGAKVPLVLSSRGDDEDTKYYSIVLASLVSQFIQKS